MPLFKKEDKSDASSYLTDKLYKSFVERTVYKHIYNYIAVNSILCQSGFLPGHSIVHHRTELIHHNSLALEKYEIICHVFCYISKAFDRVLHRGLIHKLKNMES